MNCALNFIARGSNHQSTQGRATQPAKTACVHALVMYQGACECCHAQLQKDYTCYTRNTACAVAHTPQLTHPSPILFIFRTPPQLPSLLFLLPCPRSASRLCTRRRARLAVGRVRRFGGRPLLRVEPPTVAGHFTPKVGAVERGAIRIENALTQPEHAKTQVR